MEKALTGNERIAMGVAEKTLTEFRIAGGKGCPFCKASNTMVLPIREHTIELALVHSIDYAAVHNLLPELAIPERCVRCGAEWDNVFVFEACRLTESGRPMAAPKRMKPTTPLSLPTKGKNLDEPLNKDRSADSLKLEKPTLVIADGTHPGVQRGT